AGSLTDVVNLVNSAGLGIQASLNSARTGIQLTDTTGATTSNLIVADVSGTLAADLHLTANVAATSVSSGDLNLRYITENTRLERLNGGTGVQKGQLRITDSLGGSALVDLTSSSIKTVGDVITAINGAGVGVLASINATGDGILLTDTAGGGAKLKVEETTGRIAADLNILGEAATTTIDGAYRKSITVSATDTVNDVIVKINEAKAPINLSLTNDGSTVTPHRLILSSTRSGVAGRLSIDTGTTGFSFSAVTEGADALLQVGSSGTGTTPLLFTSTTNTFLQVLPGVNVEVRSATNSIVNATITQSNENLISAFNNFVTNFNGVIDTLATQTQFNTTTNEKAVLFSDPLALQIESTLFRLSSRSYGSGTITSLSQLGIGVQDGRLTFDQAKLTAQFDNNGAALQDFLKTTTTGFADAFEQQIKAFTSTTTGQIAQRVQFIDDDSSDIKDQIERFTSRLAARRTVLEAQFLAMEQAVAALQSQSNTLTQLATLAGLTTSSSSSSKKS
ncbi:MAG: flagellar filament capping protein FliD, partial [Planctomycetaceae bacterium]|nr:flagellar filament capping protein FliD [Planctomycetaceae bacterium]